MWVRSQDKEKFMDYIGFQLIQGKDPIRLNCRVQVDDSNNTAIMGSNNGAIYCLGIYRTKERALKILDDIMVVIRDSVPDYPDAIYIMPEQ